MTTAVEVEARGTQPTVAPSEEPSSFNVVGIQITPKVRGEDVGQAYTLLEQIVPPQAGPPLHVLHQEDKTIYVAEGEFEVHVGGGRRRLLTGDCAIIPRGTVHSFKNVSTRPGRLLVTVSPAGHEKFLRTMSQLGDPATADPDTMSRLLENHRIEMLPS